MIKEAYIHIRYNIPFFFVIFFTGWIPDNRISIRFRGFLASFFIKSCGKNFTLGRDVTLLNTYNLIIGNNVYLAKGCWLNAMGGITIEDEVVFGPYVVLSSLQHTFKNYSVKQGGSSTGPIIIGKGTWLAAHASVKSNVKVGRGNLIAANSFVSKDTPDNKIMGGVPAKVIKDVENGGAVFYTRIEMMQKI
jgi:acetyltransferase-like isoleucine patch superfamily enzyme